MSEAQPKIDRRKERTRQMLHDALMELIVEKGYEAISIQDITDRANVARPTFYLHYKTKDDLLFDGLREVYDGLVHNADHKGANAMMSPDTVDASDFRHVAKHADFYRVMLSEKGSLVFLLRVLEYLEMVMGEEAGELVADRVKDPQLPAGFVGSFLAGAEIGVMHWWLKHQPEYPPEQVAAMMHKLCVRGVGWAMTGEQETGFQPSTPE